MGGTRAHRAIQYPKGATSRALFLARSASQKAIKFARCRAAVGSTVPPGTRAQHREPASRAATPSQHLRRTKNQGKESTSMALADQWAARLEVEATHRLGGNNKLNYHSSYSSSARRSRSTAPGPRSLGRRNCALHVRMGGRRLETAQTARGAWLRVSAVCTV
jgi:hypothetical protein